MPRKKNRITVGNGCRVCNTEGMQTTNQYGYHETGEGVECAACGQKYTKRPGGFAVEGSVQRSHARTCPVEPRYYRIPAVCDA